MDDRITQAPLTSGALTTSDALTPRLRSLLAAEPRDEDDAIEEIARNKLLLDQARGFLPELKRRATEAAGIRGLREVMMRYMHVYPQPERTSEEWTLWWFPYEDALANVPQSAIEAGLRAWSLMPDSEFLPKPGKFRELAMSARNPASAAYLIAHKATIRAAQIAAMEAKPQLARHEVHVLPQKLVERAEPTAEQKAHVRAMAAQFRAQVQANKPERPILPPTPVTFAPGTHLSPAMIEAMQRQDPEWGPLVEDSDDEPDAGMFS